MDAVLVDYIKILYLLTTTTTAAMTKNPRTCICVEFFVVVSVFVVGYWMLHFSLHYAVPCRAMPAMTTTTTTFAMGVIRTTRNRFIFKIQ